jgi:hypothetical protein
MPALWAWNFKKKNSVTKKKKLRTCPRITNEKFISSKYVDLRFVWGKKKHKLY